MEPTRRQLPKEAKRQDPPKPTTLEGHLFAHAAVKASRKFLQGNPETPLAEGQRPPYPPLRALNAAIDHLYEYPGDIKTFEGKPNPKGRHGKR